MNSQFIKHQIIDSLPDYVMQYCNTARGFRREKGGEFQCPICGGKLKLYRRSGCKYPWGIAAYTCGHFGQGGSYTNDSFGIYAAAHGLDSTEAYKRLMQQEGAWEEPTADYIERCRRQAAERKRKEEEYNAKRHQAQQGNLKALQTNSTWGSAVSSTGRQLIEARGICLEALPDGYQKLIGYLPRVDFRTVDMEKVYPMEGVVFRLGQSAYQIRRTHGDTYVSKEEKTARFMTLGDADIFGLTALTMSETEPLIITEGPFDALSIVQAGARRAVSLQGVANQEKILDLISKTPSLYKVVMVASDDDEAGRERGKELVEKLTRIGGVRPVYAPVFRDDQQGIGDANDWLLKDPKGLETLVALLRMEGYLFSKGWEETSHFELCIGYWKSSHGEEREKATAEVVRDLREQRAFCIKEGL